MKVFITGTAGFIGFHLARLLLAEGHTVHGYDGLTDYYDVRLKQRRHAMLREFPAFVATEAMLEDLPALQAAVQAAQPDVIVHLAAQAGVRYSLENPAAYIDAHLVGTFHLLQAVVQPSRAICCWPPPAASTAPHPHAVREAYVNSCSVSFILLTDIPQSAP
jgi:UDP-glucose 4-epimerase